MNSRAIEIVCSGCKADAMLRREPMYDGFKKVGEKLVCASCGHEFASEKEVPYKQRKKFSIFGDDDCSRRVSVFRDDEKGMNCRHCKHYVINPFTQRCGLNQRIVQATDCCGKFERKEEATSENPGEEKELIERTTKSPTEKKMAVDDAEKAMAKAP